MAWNLALGLFLHFLLQFDFHFLNTPIHMQGCIPQHQFHLQLLAAPNRLILIGASNQPYGNQFSSASDIFARHPLIPTPAPVQSGYRLTVIHNLSILHAFFSSQYEPPSAIAS